tara:strand:- start:107 stop:307 length:201 start_codon:yes stop_codon:yes gene_type:complete
MSDNKHPYLDKTLIEISEEIEEEIEEDILPLIDGEDIEEEKINYTIEDIYKKVREKLISVIRSNFP